MKQRDPGFWMIPGLAIFAFLFPLTGSLQPAPKSGTVTAEVISGKAPAPNRPKPIDGAARNPVRDAAALIHEFLGSSGGGMTPMPLEFLIATVPDPIDSRFDYLFDRNVDSLQRALEATGFVLDRFSLPWIDGRPGKEQDASEDRSFETEPGVILLRGKNKQGADSLLILFLVGETPTSGIEKAALEGALRQIDALKKDESAIRILGPTFSGSAASLDIAMRSWSAGRSAIEPHVTIISGSATAIGPDPDKGDYRIAGFPFHATVIPDAAALEAFLAHLESRHIGRNKVALLVEGNTAYGQASSRDPNLKRVVRIPYPLHIDRLRVEAARDHEVRPDAQESMGAHSLTSIPVDTNRRANDVIPSLSKLQTPTLEPMMQNVFRLISNEGIRYVGILASDIRDLLFLAREFRSHCPNTALFTLNADVLYQHPEANVDLEGMQVLTTYPLFGPNRTWTFPFADASRVHLPMDISVGVYNAALALLGEKDRMIEYAAPFADPRQERRPPLWLVAVGRDGFQPITLLRWDYHLDSSQVDYVFSGDSPGRHLEEKADAPTVDIESDLGSESIAVVSLIWCLGCVTVLWFLLRVRHAQATNQPPGPWRLLRTSMAPRLSSVLDFRRRFYLAASCCCLLLFHTLLCAVWWIPAREAGRLAGWRSGDTVLGFFTGLFLAWLLLALIALVGMAAWSLAKFWWGLRRQVTRKDNERRDLVSLSIFVGLGTFLSLIALLRLIRSWASLDPGKGMLVYARAIAFQSGISPVVPLFFTALAGLVCTACVARRLRRLDTDDETIKALPLDEDSAPGLSALETAVRRLLSCEAIRLPPPVLVAACGLALLLASVPFFTFASPFERRPFTYLFVLGYVVIYLGLAVEFGRFLCGWQIMRRVLRRLSWHPISHAFSKLREEEDGLSLLPISQAGVAHPLGVLEHALERARIVVRKAPKAAGTVLGPVGSSLSVRSAALQEALTLAEREVRLAFDAFAEGDCDGVREHRFRASTHLADIAGVVSGALRHQWLDVDRGTASCECQPASAQDLVSAGERFLASHCVIFVTQSLNQLQHLAALVTAGLLLMLLAATSYPFQPRNWILLFNWMVVLGAVAGTMAVWLQMSRNPLLSDLSGTEAGKTAWDRDMILRVAIYGVLPILGLLGAQFPATFGHFFTIFRTILGGN